MISLFGRGGGGDPGEGMGLGFWDGGGTPNFLKRGETLHTNAARFSS